MNTRNLLILLLAAISLVSCQKDEDVKPATNPRFSVAYVQNIDASGVEFAANVYEFGSEEILEYGFVFSRNLNPKLETADIVRQVGKPDNVFKLTADYAMQEGMEYFVAAFIKTNRSIVYSEQIKFTSKGSLGFIFESISASDGVYFGDTITVHGRNFSRVSSNYRVQISGFNVGVIDPTDSQFKIVLPYEFPFSSDKPSEGAITFLINISGKELNVDWVLNFREPEFENLEIQEISFSDRAEIRGKYLRSESVKVLYKNDGGTVFELPIDSYTDDKIVFKPLGRFDENIPEFNVLIRGKTYQLQNLIKLKSTNIEPGQKIEIQPSYYLEIAGSNFLLSNKDWNRFYIEDSDLSYEISHVLENSITISLSPGNSGYFPREVNIYANNAGQLSNHFVSVKNIYHTIPFFRLNHIPNNELKWNSSVSGKDHAYVFSRTGIFKFSQKERTLKLVHLPVDDRTNLGDIFAVENLKNQIFIGGLRMVDAVDYQIEIYHFNPATNDLIKIPTIPTKAIRPSAVYATDRYLYYEGGFIGLPPSDLESLDKWRYDLIDRKWEKLDSATEAKGIYHKYQTYWYQNVLYKIGQEGFFENQSIYRFREDSESWSLVKTFSFGDEIINPVPRISGDYLFISANYRIIRVNLIDFSESSTMNSDYTLRHRDAFMVGGRMYTSTEPFIYETDPSYFKYD